MFEFLAVCVWIALAVMIGGAVIHLIFIAIVAVFVGMAAFFEWITILFRGKS